MKGYGSRTKPSEGVRQDLPVKALALQDETGATSVLVTSDFHSYTRRMSDTIADAVQKKHGLPRDRLILNGSPTHSGPAVAAESWLRPSEDINAEQEAVIRRYTARLLDQVVDLIGRAIADLAPADLAFGQGSAAIGVNRRRLQNGTRHLPGVVDQRSGFRSEWHLRRRLPSQIKQEKGRRGPRCPGFCVSRSRVCIITP